MEVPISDLEAYFGIKLSQAYDDLIDQIQSRDQDQEIDETSWYSSRDSDADQG